VEAASGPCVRSAPTIAAALTPHSTVPVAVAAAIPNSHYSWKSPREAKARLASEPGPLHADPRTALAALRNRNLNKKSARLGRVEGTVHGVQVDGVGHMRTTGFPAMAGGGGGGRGVGAGRGPREGALTVTASIYRPMATCLLLLVG